jgi:histidyl-tRNA synthetase
VCLALDKRGRIGDEEVRAMLAAAGLSPATADRVFDVFRAGDLAEAQRLLGERLPCLDAVEEFSALAAAYGLADVVRFDISVVRGLAYYTGIVFEAFDAQRRFRAIFGGGRYDNLLREVGGRPATGVGLGFGDVVVAELLSALGRDVAPRRPSGIAVGFMEEAQRHTAVLAAAAFRRRGERTDLALRPERAKAFFSRCDRGGFARAVYIGPDDAAAGTVRVKDLAARSEREVALSALLSAGQPSGAAPEAAAP